MPTITLNSITLGGKPCYDVEEFACCNYFACHTGADRPGVGWFVMARQDYLDLIGNLSPGNPSTFPLVMKSNYGPGLDIQVVIGGAEPLSVVVGTVAKMGNQADDLIRVKVLDARSLLFTPFSGSFNEMSQASGGFAWDSADSVSVCYPASLNSGNPFTWAQIVSAIPGCPSMPAGAPTWTPYNFVFDNIPLARVVGNALSRIYYVVGWSITGQVWTCNIPGSVNATNLAYFNQAKAITVTAGGIAERNLSRAPANFQVTFRAFNADDPDPYATTGGYSRNYTQTVNVNIGVGPTQPLQCGSAIAIWSGGAWANSTQLNSIAADLAPRAYAHMTPTPSQWEFDGIWPFSPDGGIRGIMWISDNAGARTIIRLNNDADFNSVEDQRRVMDAKSNTLLTAIGTGNVTMDSGSQERQVWSPSGTTTVTAKIYAPLASFMGGAGAGRYKISVGTGQIAALDPTTNFRPPDSAMTFPAGFNAIWCNVFEAGSAAAGTCLLTPGTIVQGVRVGSTNDTPPLPVYYGGSMPAGTLFQAKLICTNSSGGNGNATTAASYTYDIWLWDNSVQLAAGVTPETTYIRPNGTRVPATAGACFLDTTGVIRLAQPYETYGTQACA